MTARPRRNSREVDAKVVELLLPQVARWNEIEETETIMIGELRHTLSRALVGSSDGYGIARHLEMYCGWSPDSELVEILDGVIWYRTKSYDEILEDWVRAEGIVPLLGVGAEVIVRACPGEEHRGVIIKVLPKTAVYVVRIPELGHVEEGTGSHGRYVNFEDVEAVNPGGGNG